MKKYSLILLVVLISVAGLLAAAAYSTAMVANASSQVIIETGQAHLALIPNEAFSDFVAVKNGKLVIDFGAADHGMQPGSSYSFKDLFYVKNNLATTDVEFGLRFDSIYPGTVSMPGLHTVTATGKDAYGAGGGAHYGNCLMHLNGGVACCDWANGRKVRLSAEEEVGINFNFSVGASTQIGPKSFTLQVHSVALGR